MSSSRNDSTIIHRGRGNTSRFDRNGNIIITVVKLIFDEFFGVFKSEEYDDNIAQ